MIRKLTVIVYFRKVFLLSKFKSERDAKIFGVFRVKNHDFTPKNHMCSIAEGGAKLFEAFRVKNHDFTPKNHYFYMQICTTDLKKFSPFLKG
jgi:hypothetical protein